MPGKVQNKSSAERNQQVQAWAELSLKQRKILETLGHRRDHRPLPKADTLLKMSPWRKVVRLERSCRHANAKRIETLQCLRESEAGPRRRPQELHALPHDEPIADLPPSELVDPAGEEPWHGHSRRAGTAVADAPGHDNTPQPMLSGCCATCAPRHVRTGLRSLAASVVCQRLVEQPEELAILAMNLNEPRVEGMFNTKLSVQFSWTAPEAKCAPQYMSRRCAECYHGDLPLGADCTETPGCDGCSHCVGRKFKCPDCKCIFERRWAYEAGSGRTVVGRDPANFEIRAFTKELDHARDSVTLPWSRSNTRPTGCTMVFYLGASYCMACKLKLPHGTKHCGSVLKLHRDRVRGANSQTNTANRTLSVGDPRTLRMQLMVDGDPREREAERVEYELGPGRDFQLHPADEELAWRQFSDGGRVVRGSYYHAMPQQLRKDGIACGFVFRELNHVRDVLVSTNMVIMTREERRHYELDPAPRHWKYKTRAEAYATVREEWVRLAPRYSRAVRKLVERALKRWEEQSV